MRRTIGLVMVVCAFAAVGCGSTAGSSGEVSTDGTELTRYPFAGSPDADAQKATVAVLNMRLRAADLGAEAVLVDGVVVVSSTDSAPPSREEIAALARPARLEFRPVLGLFGSEAQVEAQSAIPPLTPQSELDAPDAATKEVVLGQIDLDTNEVIATYRLGPVVADGSALEGASAVPNRQTPEWEVHPTFKEGADGIDTFNAVAAVCFAGEASCPPMLSPNSHGFLAVVLDDRVLTAPSINGASFERDQIVISGFSESLAKTLALLLTTGALPAALEVDGD